MQAAVGRGHQDEDFAALLIEQARSAGLELEPEDVDVDDGLEVPVDRREVGHGSRATGEVQVPAHLGRVPPSPGRMAVDFEERVDFDRLRRYRLARARAALEASDLGAVLLFDINNIRYVSATMIGEWARDKVARYTLLTRSGDPIVWDFGSAAQTSPAATRRGSSRRTAGPACSACAARSPRTPG